MSLGFQGEEVASNYLKNKGYQVLERNFRCKMGEIDIIACIHKTLVFVEVKTRRNLKFGLPCEAITKNKKVHIKKVAAF
ncbi:YraN family protein, partial [Aminipila sp.]